MSSNVIPIQFRKKERRIIQPKDTSYKQIRNLKKMKNFQKIKTFLKNLMRSVELFNSTENERLTEELNERIREIKERNSEIVFNAYYVPKAMAAILREENYLTTPAGAMDRAASMLLSDKANGVLDEFYRFQ